MNSNSLSKVDDDAINLIEVLSVLSRGKWIIIFFVFVSFVISCFYAFSMSDVYKSEVTLSPADSSAMKIPGQLGGLAALAGVDLGNSGGGDKTKLAIEVMKSRQFVCSLIEKHDLLVSLLAVKGWNSSENKLVIDESIYNSSEKHWVKSGENLFEATPSLMDGYRQFIDSMTLVEDKGSGILKISFKHYSPHLAKKYLELLVTSINEEIRNRDIDEARRSINYLNNQLIDTNVSDLKVMLYSLIEEQTKTLMLANVREEYVFKVIDRAMVPELKDGPKRHLIVLLSVFIAFVLSVFTLLFINFVSKLRQGKL